MKQLAKPAYGSMPASIEAALDDNEVTTMISNLAFNHNRRQAELRRQFEEKSDESRANFVAAVAKIYEGGAS